jgi:hypothetical protein
MSLCIATKFLENRNLADYGKISAEKLRRVAELFHKNSPREKGVYGSKCLLRCHLAPGDEEEQDPEGRDEGSVDSFRGTGIVGPLRTLEAGAGGAGRR